MRINNNISAVVTNNQLLGTENSLSASMERLSSGLKLNHSSDNPAGMAIASKMNAQIRGLDQASANASDGTSVLETADGALKEVTEMIQRMRELSIQASNGLNSDAERRAIQVEVEALKAEIDRISETTEFNTKALLDGSCDAHVYADFSKASRIQTSNKVPAGYYSFIVEEAATQASVSQLDADGNRTAAMPTSPLAFPESTESFYNINTNQYENRKIQQCAGTIPGDMNNGFIDFIDNSTWQVENTSYSYDPDKNLITTVTYQPGPDATTFGSGLAVSGIVVINDIEVKLTAGMKGEEVYMKLRDAAELAGAEITARDAKGLGFKSVGYGEINGLTISFSSKQLADALGGFDTTAESTDGSQTQVVIKTGTNPKIKIENRANTADTLSIFGSSATQTFDGRKVTFSDTNDFEITLMLAAGFQWDGTTPETGRVELLVTDIGVMKLQIGANEGQSMDVRISSTDCASLYIDDLTVETQRSSDKAISQLDYALSRITEIRSQLGAYTNRLEHTIKSLDETDENMQSAISRIQDVDMATEMVEYTKYNVLEQAGVAALSQANELPQLALQLLQK